MTTGRGRADALVLPGCSVLVLLALVGAAMFLLFGGRGPAPPELLEPEEGGTVATLTPTFRWRPAPGTTQIEIRVIPEDPNAATIRLVEHNRGAFTVPPADRWCCLKQGVTYRWSVRASDSPVPLPPERQYWGPWAPERRFVVEQAGK